MPFRSWFTILSVQDEKKEAESRFRLIATAYETLKDDDSRADYNYMLENPEGAWRSDVSHQILETQETDPGFTFFIAEYYQIYYRYYRRRVSPKVDIKVVLIVSISVISAIQYFLLWGRYNEAIKYLVRCSDLFFFLKKKKDFVTDFFSRSTEQRPKVPVTGHSGRHQGGHLGMWTSKSAEENQRKNSRKRKMPRSREFSSQKWTYGMRFFHHIMSLIDWLIDEKMWLIVLHRWLIDWLIDRLSIVWSFDWLIDWSALYRVVVWLICWLTLYSMVVWLIDWLIDLIDELHLFANNQLFDLPWLFFVSGGYGKPTYRDILWVKIFYLPYTVYLFFRWYIRWAYRYIYQKLEYEEEDRLYLIRKHLKYSQTQFDAMPEEERTDVYERELWCPDKFKVWISSLNFLPGSNLLHNRSIDWLIDWLVLYCVVIRLIDWLIGFLLCGRLIDWLIGFLLCSRSIDWLIDSLTDLEARKGRKGQSGSRLEWKVQAVQKVDEEGRRWPNLVRRGRLRKKSPTDLLFFQKKEEKTPFLW